MNFEIGFTLSVVVIAVVALGVTRAAPDLVLVGCLGLLLLAGVIEPGAALQEFGNEGLVTIAVLFVVAEGMQQTGAVTLLAQQVMGAPTSRASAQARMMIPTAVASAFVNNTPIVALLMPVLDD